ncbi:hypothetical protein LY474_11915 [Myxococcus stipitatus]|uniref:hypothetical protein n=1 Tax=Myxococcus stipitatus TaxID=83455 RepID=UPI001F374A0A|nr:hypothetical protein [Myxococcus stipitatus]MCE9668518.1 hypothetical protein [Myxococcus stipitatus]
MNNASRVGTLAIFLVLFAPTVTRAETAAEGLVGENAPLTLSSSEQLAQLKEAVIKLVIELNELKGRVNKLEGTLTSMATLQQLNEVASKQSGLSGEVTALRKLEEETRAKLGQFGEELVNDRELREALLAAYTDALAAQDRGFFSTLSTWVGRKLDGFFGTDGTTARTEFCAAVAKHPNSRRSAAVVKLCGQ